MSTTNLVTHPELVERFDITLIGCGSHARRPFALYEDEDPVRCGHMLHLFTGLSIHEERLDAIGRNRDNVLAVRGNESKKLWNDILELAKAMTPVLVEGDQARQCGSLHHQPLRCADRVSR